MMLRPICRAQRAWWVNPVWLLMLLALAGCAPNTGKSEYAGPDWSRGEFLGRASISQRPGLAWDAGSESALLVWLATVDDQWRLQFARVNGKGQLVALHALPLALRRPTQPRLWYDSLGGLHLFWLDAEESALLGLYHVRLSVRGEVLGEPQRLSAKSSELNGYALAEGVPGQVALFWSDSATSPAELYYAGLRVNGAPNEPPRALGLPGKHPACAADTQGRIHLVWHAPEALGAERIYYASLAPRTMALGGLNLQAAFPAGTGLSLYPPEIGLEHGRVYILWSQERRGGGAGPGTATTYYQTFLISDPASRTGGTLDLPALARPGYAPATSAPGNGRLNYRALAYLGQEPHEEPPVRTDGGSRWSPQALLGLWGHTTTDLVHEPSEYTYMPYVIPGERGELALVVANRMAMPRREGKIQVAFAVLQGGQVRGYQVAGRTRTIALRPVAVADSRGAIHLAWLEASGFGQYDLYYASTSPAVRDALNRLSTEDVLDMFLGRAWDAATALAFFPVLIVWWFVPFAFLVFFQVSRPESDLRHRAGMVALVAAIVLYLLSKFLLFPALLWYAPYLDAVPTAWEGVLFFGLPALIAALSLLAMQGYIRRSERKVALFAFVLFAGLDSVLSLLVYMPGAFGG